MKVFICRFFEQSKGYGFKDHIQIDCVWVKNIIAEDFKRKGNNEFAYLKALAAKTALCLY